MVLPYSKIMRVVRPSPLKSAVFNTPPPLMGGIFLYGKIGCLEESTQIFVIGQDGSIMKEKISNLFTSFGSEVTVLSYNFDETKKYKICPARAVIVDSGMKDVYEIELSNGEKILATEEHVFFRPTGEEVLLKDLKVNDSLFARNCIFGKRNPAKKSEVRSKLREVYKNNLEMHRRIARKMGKNNKGKRLGDNNPARRPEVRKIISKKIRKHRKRFSKMFSGKGNPMYGKVVYPKARFVIDLNHKIRSSWEENVCRVLKAKNIKYLFEPETFKLNNDTYTPDIKINDNLYLEVKGPIFDKQYHKMLKFKRKYPSKRLIIICKKSNVKKFKKFEVIAYEDIIGGSDEWQLKLSR